MKEARFVSVSSVFAPQDHASIIDKPLISAAHGVCDPTDSCANAAPLSGGDAAECEQPPPSLEHDYSLVWW